MGEGAPIIVAASFAPADLAYLDRLRRAHFPPERNHLAAHLTLFHHLPPSLLPELRVRLADAARAAPPPARISAILDFGAGTALRIDSPALVAIRASLAEVFAGLLTPQDAAGWRPHVTIQNKVDRAAARALQQVLRAVFVPRPLAIAGLAAYYYRGGPWEPIAAYRFNPAGRPRRS